MQTLLGIDIGTSGCKTVLFDVSGAALSSHTAEYPLSQPQNGWAEQDPEHWWQATVEGIRAVLAQSGADAASIAGIGLSGQMHGLVMLDKNGAVLRPCIIWADQRTAAECEEINRRVGTQRVIEITANPPMTGFTAAKILWVRNNEPQIYERCAHILLPKDYIRYRLSGEFATDVSDASGMQLMDVAARKWSLEILSKLEIDPVLLAPLYESPDITAVTSAAAADETGLCAKIPIGAGAGDNPAAAVGTGVVGAGRAFTTIGSSAVIYAVADTLRTDLLGRVHGLCASVPGKWTVMSCTQGAGLSLKWLRDSCCAEEIQKAQRENIDPYVLMDKLAKDIPIGADRLLFLPYLMGERSPHPDPNCRGVFFGLSALHTRAHLIRAVLEGVAFSQRDCLDVFREMEVLPDEMILTGGGGRSPLWRQMLADLYNTPVYTLRQEQGAVLGAALLAGVGTGVYSTVEEACANVIKMNAPQPPNAQQHRQYEPFYQLYRKLYPRMKESFADLLSLRVL